MLLHTPFSKLYKQSKCYDTLIFVNVMLCFLKHGVTKSIALEIVHWPL